MFSVKQSSLNESPTCPNSASNRIAFGPAISDGKALEPGGVGQSLRIGQFTTFEKDGEGIRRLVQVSIDTITAFWKVKD